MWSKLFRFDRHLVTIINIDSTVSHKHIIGNISETVKSLSSPYVKIHITFMKLKSDTQKGGFEIEHSNQHNAKIFFLIHAQQFW